MTKTSFHSNNMKNEITMRDLMNEFTKMHGKIDVLNKKIDNIDQKFETKFDQLDKKFEAKFDLLFDAIGDINEKFTVMDYKFLQLKRQFHAA